MPHRYRGQPIEVEAVQWTGENLPEIQQLLAPMSPLYDGDKQLGVHVTKTKVNEYDCETTLVFVQKGDWIVARPDTSLKSGRRVSTVPEAEFSVEYTPVVTTVEQGRRDLIADAQPVAASNLPRPSWERDARAARQATPAPVAELVKDVY